MMTHSADGTTIAYDIAGEGPALIYVNGAIQHRAISQEAAEMASLLSPHFTVITYDRRGRGESGDTQPYAVEREIEDLAALIEVAGGSACVFGESSGAVLALRAARHGLPISKLACYEPPFMIDPDQPTLAEDFAERFDRLIGKGRRAEAFAMFMTEAVGLPAEMAAGIKDDPMWPVLESVTHTIAYDREVMGNTQSGDPSTLSPFAVITTPTLVMAGSESAAYNQTAAKVLTDVLPDVHYRTLAGQSHQFSAAAVGPVIAGFFTA
jgi:pimeloyl-ACP methyl ester carboxylesterase